MKLFIAPNSAVTFDSAMGYKTNPQLAENQAADFSFAPNLPQPLKVLCLLCLIYRHQKTLPPSYIPPLLRNWNTEPWIPTVSHYQSQKFCFS